MEKAFNKSKQRVLFNSKNTARFFLVALLVLWLPQLFSVFQANALTLTKTLNRNIVENSSYSVDSSTLNDSSSLVLPSSTSSSALDPQTVTNVTKNFGLPDQGGKTLNQTSATNSTGTKVDSISLSSITSLFALHQEHSDKYNEFDLKNDSNLSQKKVSFALQIVVRISIFLYCCLVIGYLCDEYFVPSLESIGQALNLRSDLIGSVLIPFGTSGPEIFSSAAGVFFAENDIGTGAIIGSAVFNILLIPAASGLAAWYFIGNSIKLDKEPILRDLTFYSVSIIVLILAIKDNTVDFIDSLLFATLFVIYIGVMFYSGNRKPSSDNSTSKSGLEKCKLLEETVTNITIKNNEQIINNKNNFGYATVKNNLNNKMKNPISPINNIDHKNVKNKMKEHLNEISEIINEKNPTFQKLKKLYGIEYQNGEYWTPELLKTLNMENNIKTKINFYIEEVIEKQQKSLMGNFRSKIEYEKLDANDNNGVGFTDNVILRVLLSPFVVLFTLTMPSRFPSVMFAFSIIWLSILAYGTVWSISGLSELIGIPPTISGMTILAAGSAVPDLVTSIIVIKKTSTASMGICAAISSNIFAILLGLGLPWGSQFMLHWIKSGNYTSSAIKLQSSALPYTSMILLVTILALFFTFRICKWKISKKFSLICVLIYLLFVTSSTSLELFLVS